MKLLKLIMLFLSVASLKGMGQIDQHKKQRILNILTLPSGKQLLVKDLLVAPFEIKDFRVLNEGEIKKGYKDANADIIFQLTTKPNVVLIGLTQLLDMYNIDDQYRTFTILFQNSQLQDPKTLLASKTLIRGIEIDKAKRTLNIKTAQYEKAVLSKKKIQSEQMNKAKIQ